jgi:flagellar biosynthesis/type III secretory pathway protein FliH
MELSALEKIRNDSLAQGREEGIEIGEARGEARGIEKTAINMLQQKFDPQVIATVTGLTLEEVLKLQNRALSF